MLGKCVPDEKECYNTLGTSRKPHFICSSLDCRPRLRKCIVNRDSRRSEGKSSQVKTMGIVQGGRITASRKLHTATSLMLGPRDQKSILEILSYPPCGNLGWAFNRSLSPSPSQYLHFQPSTVYTKSSVPAPPTTLQKPSYRIPNNTLLVIRLLLVGELCLPVYYSTRSILQVKKTIQNLAHTYLPHSLKYPTIYSTKAVPIPSRAFKRPCYTRDHLWCRIR